MRTGFGRFDGTVVAFDATVGLGTVEVADGAFLGLFHCTAIARRQPHDRSRHRGRLRALVGRTPACGKRPTWHRPPPSDGDRGGPRPIRRRGGVTSWPRLPTGSPGGDPRHPQTVRSDRRPRPANDPGGVGPPARPFRRPGSPWSERSGVLATWSLVRSSAGGAEGDEGSIFRARPSRSRWRPLAWSIHPGRHGLPRTARPTSGNPSSGNDRFVDRVARSQRYRRRDRGPDRAPPPRRADRCADVRSRPAQGHQRLARSHGRR